MPSATACYRSTFALANAASMIFAARSSGLSKWQYAVDMIAGEL